MFEKKTEVGNPDGLHMVARADPQAAGGLVCAGPGAAWGLAGPWVAGA